MNNLQNEDLEDSFLTEIQNKGREVKRDLEITE